MKLLTHLRLIPFHSHLLMNRSVLTSLLSTQPPVWHNTIQKGSSHQTLVSYPNYSCLYTVQSLLRHQERTFHSTKTVNISTARQSTFSFPIPGTVGRYLYVWCAAQLSAIVCGYTQFVGSYCPRVCSSNRNIDTTTFRSAWPTHPSIFLSRMAQLSSSGSQIQIYQIYLYFQLNCYLLCYCVGRWERQCG